MFSSIDIRSGEFSGRADLPPVHGTAGRVRAGTTCDARRPGVMLTLRVRRVRSGVAAREKSFDNN